MHGANIDDYAVTVGDVTCLVTDLSSDSLSCMVARADISTLSRNTDIPIQVD